MRWSFEPRFHNRARQRTGRQTYTASPAASRPDSVYLWGWVNPGPTARGSP